MQKTVHRADSRGRAEHGWLHSRHTFSFAMYHNPERMQFGKLRVLNDDVVDPGAGFDTHPHDNMEIISVPLAGTLRHRDSMGNVHIIRAGEIQLMSAGTGITHSEYNDSQTEAVNFLQIWVLPKRRDTAPRYEQRVFDPAARQNRLQLAVSPDGRDGSLVINQDAWFSLTSVDAGLAVEYAVQNPGNGVYVFVISGEISCAAESLGERDAMGVSGADRLSLQGVRRAEVLLIEVPLD
jgi:redox-sensitive bicupin YhaK (pirin superfamily)